MTRILVGNTTSQYNGYNKENSKDYVKDIGKGVSSAAVQNPLSGTGYKVITPSNASKQTSTVFNMIDTANSSRGVSVFRVDGAHGKSNYNHFNTNSKLYQNNSIYKGLNHKPISKATYAVAKNSTAISKAVKVGGRAISVVALISDGMDIYDSYKEDGDKIGKNTVTTTSGAAGSWIGAVGGAKGGAYGGAAIGSMICPGIGTAIGAGIGGIVGGIAGGIAGQYAGEEISGAIYDKVKEK